MEYNFVDVASIAVTVDGSSFATRFTTTAMAKATTIIPMENAPGAIFLVLTEYLRFWISWQLKNRQIPITVRK